MMRLLTPDSPSSGRILAGEPDQLAYLMGLALDVIAAHQRLPGIGPEQCGQDPDGRRLAGAVGPEDAQHGTRTCHQVNSGQRRRLAETLDQPAGLDRVRHRPSFLS